MVQAAGNASKNAQGYFYILNLNAISDKTYNKEIADCNFMLSSFSFISY